MLNTQAIVSVTCGSRSSRLVLATALSQARLARLLADCSRPSPGQTFTVAFNNVAPFVRAGSPMVRIKWQCRYHCLFVLEGGVEPQVVKEFAAKFSLDVAWLDAQFTWGSLVGDR